MINFRTRTFSLLVDGSQFPFASKVEKALDKARNYDYEFVEKVQIDTISVSAKSLKEVSIYIPKSDTYSQYMIEDTLIDITPYNRLDNKVEEKSYVITVKGQLTMPQYLKLITKITDTEGFVSLIK